MKFTISTMGRRVFGHKFAAVALVTLVGCLAAIAEDHDNDDKHFQPGNLVVSRSVYDNNKDNVKVGAILPPGCGVAGKTGACASGSKKQPFKSAPNDGTYPTVFNNNIYDGSFGITSKIFLDQITESGDFINTLEVPNSSDPGITSTSDQMVTSFSSKSEIALNLSTEGDKLTFMGYLAPVDAIDVSNSNTPTIVDPTNPVGESFYRVVAEVNQWGKFHFTLTNAYSGNNGRAAILNNRHGGNAIYTSGNAGNGGNPQPNGIIIGAGAQIMTPSTSPEAGQTPGDPTPVGSFNITQLGLAHDKIGKDTNFRGLTIFENVLYFTKGSGGNGVNTVYFIDTTGTACPTPTGGAGGVGLPIKGAVLPPTGIAFNPSNLQTLGVYPYNMCILKGFPADLNSTNVDFPFGLFFADDKTLYVAGEGSGDNTYDSVAKMYTAAAAQTTAGVQKWIFDDISSSWKYAYTLFAGLNLGAPYTVADYPTGNNSITGLPWSPATDGIRNITGEVEGDDHHDHWGDRDRDDQRKVEIWGITSTVSGSGDQGADPNKLVKVTDLLKNTDPAVAATESFSVVRSAENLEVLRGVSFTPTGDDESEHRHDSDHHHD
jgi:hypothetical protein